jgi:tape measure domain-containing protein
VASANETLDIVIRTRGGRQAAAEARMVEQAYAGLGQSVGSMRVMVDAGTESSRRASSAFMSAAGASLRLAAGYAVLRGASEVLHSGIDFVSTMEQNQIAFEQFTGSAKEATQEMGALRALANEIPAFGFDTFASNAKKLAAMGTPLNRINRDLKTMAETALGLGLGSEGIDRITLAIGQMRSTGVVQGDELRQLQEAGIKVYDYMVKAGIITQKDIGQIGQMHIDAATAIDAIMNGMAADFGGLSKRAEGTWAYQMGNLKNQASAAAGALVRPIVRLAEEKWLPVISEHFRNWSVWLNSGGAERLYDTMAKLAKVIGPIAAGFGAFKIIMWAVGGVTALAGGLAAVWGTLSAVVALLPAASTLGDVLYVIGSAFGIIGAGGAVAVGAVVAAVLAVIAAVGILYWKVGWFRDAVNDIAKGLWWLFGETIGGLIIGSIVTWSEKAWHALQKLWDLVKAIGGGIASVVGSIAHAPGNLLGSLGGGKGDIPGIPFMAGGGTIPPGGAAVVGEAGAEIARNRGGRTEITPLAGSSAPRMLQPLQLMVDGRVFAEAMVEIGQTAAARA